MAAQVVTLSTAGDLRIPDELQQTLGMRPGSRVEILVQDGKLIAQPVPFDDIRSLRGILSSEKNMVEELQQERRQDKW
jgi:bifunctional DNA-binding transcriptional regulator/antitoxin component of YhaV-PrlF toxin-antitoxin module